MKLLQRRAILKGANYLDLRPAKIAKEEIDENNMVTILYPKFISKFAQKYIIPKMRSPHVRLKLDALGSAAWLAIDGVKKVSEIVQELEKKFDGKEPGIEERLTRFLTLLYEQKIISFAELLERDKKAI